MQRIGTLIRLYISDYVGFALKMKYFRYKNTKKKLEVNLDGFNNPHPAAFTIKYAKLLKLLKKNRIHFGVDSLSDKVLDYIKIILKDFLIGFRLHLLFSQPTLFND